MSKEILLVLLEIYFDLYKQHEQLPNLSNFETDMVVKT